MIIFVAVNVATRCVLMIKYCGVFVNSARLRDVLNSRIDIFVIPSLFFFS